MGGLTLLLHIMQSPIGVHIAAGEIAVHARGYCGALPGNGTAAAGAYSLCCTSDPYARHSQRGV